MTHPKQACRATTKLYFKENKTKCVSFRPKIVSGSKQTKDSKQSVKGGERPLSVEKLAEVYPKRESENRPSMSNKRKSRITDCRVRDGRLN